MSTASMVATYKEVKPNISDCIGTCASFFTSLRPEMNTASALKCIITFISLYLFTPCVVLKREGVGYRGKQ